MNGILQQIKAAYEVNGMTPEQISADFSDKGNPFTIEAVKAALMQCSTQYRKACKAELETEDKLNFSFDEQIIIKNELLQLALSTEDEHLKGKLLLNLRDDGRGRKDVIKKLNGTTFNILQFNQQLQAAKMAVVDAKKKLIEA
jgi:hypothetical protein